MSEAGGDRPLAPRPLPAREVIQRLRQAAQYAGITHTDPLAPMITAFEGMVEYMDFRLQHNEDRILQDAMRRGWDIDQLKAFFASERDRICGALEAAIADTETRIMEASERQEALQALCAELVARMEQAIAVTSLIATSRAQVVTGPVAAAIVGVAFLALGIIAYGLGTSRVTAAEAAVRELGQAWLAVFRQDPTEGRGWLELAAANRGRLAAALAACVKAPPDRSVERAACYVPLSIPETVTTPAGPAR